MDSTFTPSHRGGSGPPLVCLHGFTDTWRTWELVLPQLERHHDVLAPTLLGHAGGPPLDGEVSDAAIVDAVECAMDEAGFATAHLVGNSLGGYVALQLAARGRAQSVVALAPAGGWAVGDESFRDTLGHFVTMQELLEKAIPHVDAIVATTEGRRRATQFIATRFEHIPTELVAHLMCGAASCTAVLPLVEQRLAPARRLGRAGRRRPLPPARRAARDGTADPGLHGPLTSGSSSGCMPRGRSPGATVVVRR